MSGRRISFCIVCVANYCRSPVFEHLLRNKFGDKYEFYSSGLSPITVPNMDPRSRDYLESCGVKNILHNPKPITKKMLNYFDYFLAVDLYTLNGLCYKFPNHKEKHFLITSRHPNIDIIDPHLLNNDEDYLKIMDRINYIVENINFNDFSFNNL